MTRVKYSGHAIFFSFFLKYFFPLFPLSQASLLVAWDSYGGYHEEEKAFWLAHCSLSQQISSILSTYVPSSALILPVFLFSPEYWV